MNHTAVKNLTIGATLVLVACAGVQVGAQNETDVRIIDLKRDGVPVAWIDNETLLLYEGTGERVKRKSGYVRGVNRLVSLNYRSGELHVYGQTDSEICYADGYVSYIREDIPTGDSFAVYGQLGKETITKIAPSVGRYFDNGPTGSCRPFSERFDRPQWLDQKSHFWRLWPHAGLIDCRSGLPSVSDKYVKARFHKANDREGTELTFSCYEVLPGMKYYPFKDAYFALEHDFRWPWPKERDRRVFWLYPDGRVETTVLPYSNAIRETGIPTARGLVTFARPTERGEDYWIYLVTPNAAKVIMRGHASTGVTSPNGCRVAMLHDPDYEARLDHRRVTTKVTLKVLELCQEQREVQ